MKLVHGCSANRFAQGLPPFRHILDSRKVFRRMNEFTEVIYVRVILIGEAVDGVAA